MRMKIKLIGSDEHPTFTINNVYEVLALTTRGANAPCDAIVIDDNGVPRETQQLISTRWEILSLEIFGCTSLV